MRERERSQILSVSQTENIGFLLYSYYLSIDFSLLFPNQVLSTLMKNVILSEVSQNHWWSHSKNYPFGKCQWSWSKLPFLLFQLQSLRDQHYLILKTVQRTFIIMLSVGQFTTSVMRPINKISWWAQIPDNRDFSVKLYFAYKEISMWNLLLDPWNLICHNSMELSIIISVLELF